MNRFRYLNIPQFYFKVMWVFSLFLYILIPLQSPWISQIYRGIILITFLSFFYVAVIAYRNSIPLFDNIAFIFFLLLSSAAFLSLLMGDGEIRFDQQIIGILGFIEMPIAIILVDHVRYDADNLKFVFRINILIAVVFILLSRSSYAYSGRLNSLYLGYSNPNTTGIFLLLNAAILLLYLPQLRGGLSKILVIGLCLYDEYLIYLTDSRTCLAVSLVILAYELLGKNIKVPRWVIPVALLFPLAFLFIYVYLYANGKFTHLLILGKPFYSGREQYFLEQLILLRDTLLLGDARTHSFSNMHNGPLAVIASAGLVGYIFHFLFYCRTLLQSYKGIASRTQSIALIAIMGIFLHSSAEAALIVGGAHYSIIVATFYWILRQREKYRAFS